MKKALFIFYAFVAVALENISSQPVTFLKKNPNIGEEKYFSFLIKQNIEISAFQNDTPAANFLQSSVNTENKRIKILEVDSNKIKKIELFFEKVEETDKDQDVESTKVDPVSGKTYIIEEKDEKLNIIYPDGTIPSDDEIKYINDNEKDLNEENYLENMTVKIGDRCPVLETTIKNQFLNILNSDSSASSISAYLTELRNYDNAQCAVFKIEIETKAPVLETLEMNISLTGEILISIDTSNPVLLKLDGPMSMDGMVTNEGQTLVMKGKGSISYDLNVKKIK